MKSHPEVKTLDSLDDIKVASPSPVLQQCCRSLKQLSDLISEFPGNSQTYVFEDNKQALLEIFAYQLIELLLCQFKSKIWLPSTKDEINISDAILELLDKPEFELMLPSEDNVLSNSAQQNLKDIIMEFIIHAGKHCTVETANNLINNYPLILQIFVCMLRQLLALGDVCQSYDDDIGMELTYDFLGSYFGIEIYLDSHTNSLYIPRLGTYVVEESSTKIYMITTSNVEAQVRSVAESMLEEDGDSEQYSQIDAEEFSNILNSKHDTHGMSQLTNEVNVVISNIDIGDPAREINMVESTFQIEGPPLNLSQSSQKIKSPWENDQKGTSRVEDKGKGSSIATTYRSYRKSSTLCQDQKPQETLASSIDEVEKLISVLRSEKTSSKMYSQDFVSSLYLSNGFEGNKNSVFTSPSSIKAQIPIKRKEDGNQKQGMGIISIGGLKQFYEKTSETFFGTGNSSLKKTKKQTVESKFFYRPAVAVDLDKILWPEKNKKNKWINKNITREFTSSFLLEKIPEPHRGVIESKKRKAREERRQIEFNRNMSEMMF